jgi:hypothetical protein
MAKHLGSVALLAIHFGFVEQTWLLDYAVFHLPTRFLASSLTPNFLAVGVGCSC